MSVWELSADVFAAPLALVFDWSLQALALQAVAQLTVALPWGWLVETNTTNAENEKYYCQKPSKECHKSAYFRLLSESKIPTMGA